MEMYDHLGQPVNHGRARVNGIRMHYITAGQGSEALLLLHGTPKTSYYWYKLIPLLTEHFTVVAPDLRGFGYTDKPPMTDGYDSATNAQDVSELMTYLEIDKYHVHGEDRGADFAYALAASCPERVKSLSFCEMMVSGFGLEETSFWTEENVTAQHRQKGIWCWHLGFFSIPHVPEMLIQGHEHEFWEMFMRQECYNPTAIEKAALEHWQNICGLSSTEHDEIWYKAVLQACDLDHDVQRWDSQDSTIVGSQGITLSGGQKQRLALARAVYSRKELILLDDVLSALDNKTGEPSFHDLQDLPFADYILILDSQEDLALVKNPGDPAASPCMILHAEDDKDETDELAAESTSLESLTETHDQAESSDLVSDLTRSTGDLGLYAYYFQSTGWRSLIAFLAVAGTAAFAENFSQIWLKWWAADNGQQLTKYLPVYAGFLLVAMLSGPIYLWIMLLQMMPKSATTLHRRLLRTVINAPLSFLTSTDAGTTLNRSSQDMSLVDLALPIGLSTFVMACFECIAKIALIAAGSSYMAITIPFTLLAVAMIQHTYLKTSRQLRHLDLENKHPLFTHFTETLDGMTTIRAFGWQKEAMSMNDQKLDNSQKPYCMLLWFTSDAEIQMACEKVGIWSALDSRGGLEAILLDPPLSQGEQQLVCLARGMLGRSTILILDEATSSVDNDNDLQIKEVIKEHFANCTVISVAHRLDTVLSSDRIVLLDNGKVLEIDTPEDLLARDSMFRRLYRS
ncbi:hypothetical protein QM012_005618 [Aureobasidium pullulans]|uniref:P-loop containing nucleoside triphosphate hydrolase protein n=1 Tax=Aureobasidium pullulans TaxID=5580 RepID=A0ABR0T479_AURPU